MLFPVSHIRAEAEKCFVPAHPADDRDIFKRSVDRCFGLFDLDDNTVDKRIFHKEALAEFLCRSLYELVCIFRKKHIAVIGCKDKFIKSCRSGDILISINAYKEILSLFGFLGKHSVMSKNLEIPDPYEGIIPVIFHLFHRAVPPSS